jgi:hypothetical protein
MHLLHKSEIPNYPVILEKPWAAVKVRVEKKDLELTSAICVAKAGTAFAELPARIKVQAEGKPLRAEHKFYISIETIDPYHLLIDKEL